MYTLIVTAKLNDVDPQARLADVLACIAALPNTRVHDLPPWNWKAARDQPLAAEAGSDLSCVFEPLGPAGSGLTTRGPHRRVTELSNHRKDFTELYRAGSEPVTHVMQADAADASGTMRAWILLAGSCAISTMPEPRPYTPSRDAPSTT